VRSAGMKIYISYFGRFQVANPTTFLFLESTATKVLRSFFCTGENRPLMHTMSWVPSGAEPQTRGYAASEDAKAAVT
jgi:hypothetical protein